MTLSNHKIQVTLKKSGVEIVEIQPLSGGFNCDVFKGVDTKGLQYFIKCYKPEREFASNRLAAEFGGLEFLWTNGIRSIPMPIVSIPELLIGVYEFIDGKEISTETITKNVIDTALKFWKSIDLLKRKPHAKKLRNAKEASFSFQDYLNVLNIRFQILTNIPHTKSTAGMHTFINEELREFSQVISQKIIKTSGRDINRKLQHKYKTLSSSDFGFQNAIRKKDGTIIFHDFEYFGWDDPAKLIADFYLHPRMKFPERYREDFYKTVYTQVNDSSLPQRLPFVYQLLAIKWSLIMLNTFKLPGTIQGKNQIEAQTQLKKAKNAITRLKEEINNKSFPLSLVP